MKKLFAVLLSLTLIGTFSIVDISADSEVTGDFIFDLQATVYDYGEAVDAVSFSINPLK